MTTPALPGVRLTFEPVAAGAEPLRTDVAAFLGRTRRGPVDRPVRVTSWNEVVGVFGEPDGSSATPYALRGFFDNGGRTAWVSRVSGPASPASAEWTVGQGCYRVVAASPGTWANGARVAIRYQASTVAGPPTVTVRVIVPGEPAEVFAGLPPAQVVERLSASRLVRLVASRPAAPLPPPGGPISQTWDLVLAGGTDSPPDRDDYAGAVRVQADLPEPALVALPDLGSDLPGQDHLDLVAELLAVVEPLADRLVVLDVPPDLSTVDEVVSWVESLTASGDPALANAAVFHPPLLVPAGHGTRAVPASGHVLGMVARLDGERGAHHTPANAVLLDAVDLTVDHPREQLVRLFDARIDLVRCQRGRGLVGWGGRTLSGDPRRRYVAHRRLLHLLVRAIRRVAGPLVFDVNSPELRLTLVRAVTSVLLEAYRTGALAGARPEQAFRVLCDDTNNPPDQDPAQLVCEIDVAPAVPMEFIHLRLTLGQDRGLEVIES